MKDDMLDLFVLLHQQEEADSAAKADALRQPKQCAHCGDWMRNQFLLDINHNQMANGWCGRRFWANRRMNPDDLAWLAEHGFEVNEDFRNLA